MIGDISPPLQIFCHISNKKELLKAALFLSSFSAVLTLAVKMEGR